MYRTLPRIPLYTRLDAKETDFLLGSGTGLRLSLYLPFDKSWSEPLEDKILLRDLRRDALQALEGRGTHATEVEALLAPVDALLAEPDAGRFQGQGLALFADAKRSLILLLPQAPRASVQLDARFRLDGILPQLQRRDRYALLGISQQHVRLWDCDGVGMREISLEGLETDIRRTRHFREAEYQALFHSNSSGHHGTLGHGQDPARYAIGPGDGKGLKQEIELFFRQIDRGIQARLPAPGIPLILAGVGFLLPIYRRVNTYIGLIDKDLPGHPGLPGNAEDLHVRANALLAAQETEEKNLGLGLFVENLARSRSCSGYTDVVPCAARNRLTHLFLPLGHTQWGNYDPASGRTQLFDGFRPGAEDLANLACIHALLGRAKVYSMPEKELPHNAGIAALYRN
jgi:hypothetical protein